MVVRSLTVSSCAASSVASRTRDGSAKSCRRSLAAWRVGISFYPDKRIYSRPRPGCQGTGQRAAPGGCGHDEGLWVVRTGPIRFVVGAGDVGFSPGLRHRVRRARLMGVLGETVTGAP